VSLRVAILLLVPGVEGRDDGFGSEQRSASRVLFLRRVGTIDGLYLAIVCSCSILISISRPPHSLFHVLSDGCVAWVYCDPC
jgi:hypothetical protein